MEKIVDNKLKEILLNSHYGGQEDDGWSEEELVEAIAAIKQAFLEMESLEDEEAETLNHGVCNLACHAISRKLTRLAIRKEVEGNE